MQNSHVAQSSGFYKIGVYQNLIDSGGDQKIGEISSDGSTEVIDLTLTEGVGGGSTSSKLIPTVITQMDKSKKIQFAPDDADCASASLATMTNLLGPTTDTNNALYPYDSSWGATGMTEGWAIVVCTSSFYLKTNEQKVTLTWSVILALCGGALTVCMKAINNFVKCWNVAWEALFTSPVAATVAPTEKADAADGAD